MKKVIKIILIILILFIIITVFFIFAIKIINIKSKFKLDNENKYIIAKKEIKIDTQYINHESTYYYELDLNNKYIDLRYHFSYYEFAKEVSKFKRFRDTKERKLIERYNITEQQKEELKQFLEEMKIKEDNINYELLKLPSPHYSIQNRDVNFVIKDSEDKERLKEIMKGINEKLSLYL